MPEALQVGLMFAVTNNQTLTQTEGEQIQHTVLVDILTYNYINNMGCFTNISSEDVSSSFFKLASSTEHELDLGLGFVLNVGVWLH